MASTGYDILAAALSLARISEKTDLEPEALSALLEKRKEKRRYRIPEKYLRTVCSYRIEMVGERPCIIASSFGGRSERALLLFYGGGYYKTPDRRDFAYMVQVARSTRTEVWFPLYPLAPDADISSIMEHAAAVYREMLKSWNPDQIVWQGNSSGGTTCLYLCMKIKHDAEKNPGPDAAGAGERLPYPARILLVSPAVQMPPSEEQSAVMKKLEDKDPILSVNYCHSIAKLLYHPDYGYLCEPFAFDWSGFPPMMILYGTREIFSAYLPELRETGRRYQVAMKGITGRGMIHCWPLFGSLPEAEKTREKMFSFIRADDPDAADLEGEVQEEGFCCIYTAGDDVEARMVETLLKENGVPCFRKARFNGGFMDLYGGNSRMGAEIYISPEMYREAMHLLEKAGFLEPVTPEDP